MTYIKVWTLEVWTPRPLRFGADDSQQAGPAEAVGVVGGDVGPGFGGQPDAVALAFGDIAHFAFEGGLTAGANFGFSLGHRECDVETKIGIRQRKSEGQRWGVKGEAIHSTLPAGR
jgi:hypothetical protein